MELLFGRLVLTMCLCEFVTSGCNHGWSDPYRELVSRSAKPRCHTLMQTLSLFCGQPLTISYRYTSICIDVFVCIRRKFAGNESDILLSLLPATNFQLICWQAREARQESLPATLISLKSRWCSSLLYRNWTALGILNSRSGGGVLSLPFAMSQLRARWRRQKPCVCSSQYPH